MLEEHCYIIDASVTTFRSELFNDLVVLEEKMFKIIASFAVENMGKKEFSGVDRSKIIILHVEGHSEGQTSEKLKFIQDCNRSILTSSTFKWSKRG